MKCSYISPQLHIVCFSPIERLALEDLDLDLDLVRISTYSSRGATNLSDADDEDGDIVLPIKPKN